MHSHINLSESVWNFFQAAMIYVHILYIPGDEHPSETVAFISSSVSSTDTKSDPVKLFSVLTLNFSEDKMSLIIKEVFFGCNFRSSVIDDKRWAPALSLPGLGNLQVPGNSSMFLFQIAPVGE